MLLNADSYEGIQEDPMELYPDFYRSLKKVRTEQMDVAAITQGFTSEHT